MDRRTLELSYSVGTLITADQQDPKYGNASHSYALNWGDSTRSCEIEFQHGPIQEVGKNGVTNEALIAVVIDRLEGFQSGAFACRENALALTKLQEALHWLEHRTRAREARGVEGTNVA